MDILTTTYKKYAGNKEEVLQKKSRLQGEIFKEIAKLKILAQNTTKIVPKDLEPMEQFNYVDNLIEEQILKIRNLQTQLKETEDYLDTYQEFEHPLDIALQNLEYFLIELNDVLYKFLQEQENKTLEFKTKKHILKFFTKEKDFSVYYIVDKNTNPLTLDKLSFLDAFKLMRYIKNRS